MEFNLQVKFSTDTDEWLCFRHAVEAVLKGDRVQVEIDNYDSENDLRRNYCMRCVEDGGFPGKV